MKILVTAGNTQTPIDDVRCITNIFTGKTGATIATEAARRGHDVCLLTSHPEVLAQLDVGHAASTSMRVERYRTFGDLQAALKREVCRSDLECVIHAAAVSDFALAGAYVPGPMTRFDPASGIFQCEEALPRMEPIGGGKLKSSAPELWLRLTPTPKLIDAIRRDWRFRGLLVKFKLEVGMNDEALRQVASRARAASDADLIVANSLESKDQWAWIGDVADHFDRVERHRLAETLVKRIEALRNR